ncbi:MAG TPA: hypothetical protein VGN57_08090 [Pirellulaceae bacterium]|jgi:hypothetical protein|nr:hypothetical protein [Pirellulaceae bacterium]
MRAPKTRGPLRTLSRAALLLWASPYTLIGIAVGLLGLVSGGKVQVRRGVVEFYGGFVQWALQRLPTGPLTMAMTLGHCILGQTDASLDVARDHEHVHVRQFERWGPLMGPAYLGASVYVWLRGRRAYRDNPFEVEAYDAVPRGSSKRRE